MNRTPPAVLAYLAAALAGTATVFAADEAAAPAEEIFPYVELELETTLGDDFTFRSNDPGAEINDLFPEAALAVKIGLTPIFSINAGLTLEPVRDPEPFEDRVFRDIGLYVDTLNLQADVDNLSLVAGKFGPGFGRAWDNTPGIYGTSFAEDYELSEQIASARPTPSPVRGARIRSAPTFSSPIRPPFRIRSSPAAAASRPPTAAPATPAASTMSL